MKEATTSRDGISDHPYQHPYHGMRVDVCLSSPVGASARVSLELPTQAPHPVTLRQCAAPAITADAVSTQVAETEEGDKPASDAQPSALHQPSPDSYPNTDAAALSDWQPVD